MRASGLNTDAQKLSLGDRLKRYAQYVPTCRDDERVGVFFRMAAQSGVFNVP
jgi:hypothetical protein